MAETLSLGRMRPDRPKSLSVKGFDANLGRFFRKVPLGGLSFTKQKNYNGGEAAMSG